MTDAALIGKWRAERDAEAFRQLALRYSGMVYATCLRILGNAHDAEEISQECFEKLAQSEVSTVSYLGPWLHRVATNRSLDRLRREGRRLERETRYATGRDAAEPVEWNDIHAFVDEAIADLAENLRAPLVAHFFENRTHEAIAVDLGVPRPTVTYRIHKGLEKVRRSLKKRGVDVAVGTLAALFGANLAEAAVVPATLEAALGRIAVAGVKTAAAPVAAAGAFAVLAPLAAKVAAGIAAVAVAAGATWYAVQSKPPRDANTPQAGAAVAMAPAEPAAGPETASPPSSPPVEASSKPARAAAPRNDVVGPAVNTGNSVSGRVYDAVTGQGIAGARVSVMPADEKMRGGDAETDAEGRYRADGLGAGVYEVLLNSRIPGYPRLRNQTIDVTIPDGGHLEGLDFKVAPGVRVTGRVTSADGKPVAGAEVGAMTEDMPGAEQGKSGPDGTFVLALSEPGQDLVIQAETEDFQSPMLKAGTLPPEGLGGIELALTLPRTASIEGRLVLPDGRPAEGYTLHPDSGNTGYLIGLRPAEADKDGTFRFEKLAAGTYGISLSEPGQSSWTSSNEVARLTVKEGQALQGVVIRTKVAQAGLVIAGRVEDSAGKPLGECEVSLYGRGAFRNVRTAKDGSFLIDGLDEDTYGLNVHGADGEHGFTQVNGVQAGRRDVVVVLPGLGSVEGRVVNQKGEPVTQFDAYVTMGEFSAFSPQMLMNNKKVNSPEGRFRLEMLYDGPETVTVMAPGYAPAFTVVNVKEYQTVSGVELRLEPSAGPFTGTVVNTAGEPVADARIYLSLSEPWVPMTQEPLARTGADGAFSIDNFPPTVQAFYVTHPKYAPAKVAVQDASRIVLPTPGAIEGRVTVAGQPVSTCRVSTRNAEHGTSYVKPGEDGSYRLEGLAPGTVAIQAGLEGGRVAYRDVVIEPGATTRVDFAFGAADGAVEGDIRLDGNPVSMANVELTVESEGGQEQFFTGTKSEGHYVFEDVPAGAATMTVMFNSSESEMYTRRAELRIEPGTVVRHDFNIAGSGVLTGTVRGLSRGDFCAVSLLLPNAPVADAVDREALSRLMTEYSVAMVQCGENGAFRLEHVEPGDYIVMAVGVPQDRMSDPTAARIGHAPVHVGDTGANVELTVK